MRDSRWDAIEALTERIMEHVCGWPDEGDVAAVAAIIIDHPEVLDAERKEAL